MRIHVLHLLTSLLLLVAAIFVGYHLIDGVTEKSYYDYFLKLGDDDYTSTFKKQWLQPDVEETMYLHLFDQIDTTVSPNVAPIGPFKYNVFQHKEIIEETDDELTYQPTVHYVLDASHSGSKNTSQLIRMPNVPLFAAQSIIAKSSNDPPLVAKIMQFLDRLGRIPSIVQHQVEEFTFAGYTDSLIVLIDRLQVMGLIKDHVITDTRFSLFRNGTGKLTVSKGLDNIKKTGQLLAWNGMRETNLYAAGSPCNRVHGSNGQNFGAFLYETQLLFVFIPEFCTAVPFKYVRDTTTFGVSTRRYEFAFGDANHDKCFITNGMHDVSQCNHLAPIVLTAARTHSNSSSEEVNSFVEVEPTTGVTLKASISFQVNLMVDASADVSSNGTVLAPLMRVERNAEAQDEAISGVKRIKTYHIGAQVIAWTASLLFVVLALFLVAIPVKKIVDGMRPADEPLVQDNE